jgi:hypothetical protein
VVRELGIQNIQEGTEERGILVVVMLEAVEVLREIVIMVELVEMELLVQMVLLEWEVQLVEEMEEREEVLVWPLVVEEVEVVKVLRARLVQEEKLF